jgi:hypothetical protein
MTAQRIDRAHSRETFDKGGRLAEATTALQNMLAGRAASGKAAPATQRNPPTIEGVVEPARSARGNHAPRTWPRFGAAGGGRTFASGEFNLKSAVSNPLCGFFEQSNQGNFQLPVGGLAPLSPNQGPVIVPDGAWFLAKNFSNQAGSRPYTPSTPSMQRAPATSTTMPPGACSS